MGTAAEAAAIIRRELKTKHGITSRQVSVRADVYSMGSAIRIKIKDPSVRKPIVEEIASSHERVDRDQWGEILSGGNRFVDVSYTVEAIAPIAAEALAVLDTLTDDGQHATFRGWELSRPKGAPNHARWWASHPKHTASVQCHAKEHCARQVAELILNEGVW